MPERLPISLDLLRTLTATAKDFRKEPTPSERLLRQALRGRRLDVKFRRQQPIGPFIADFFCAQHALIVEVDGPIHESQTARDQERQELLEACGCRVIRVTAHDVEHHLDAVIGLIKTTLSPSSSTDERA